MSAPDIVIPVRRGSPNEELRYALRSLRFVPHGAVWLVGAIPVWSTGTRCILTAQRGTKWENAAGNIRQAVEQDEMADEVVVWNDDFFALRPLDRVPVTHRGPLAELIAATSARNPGSAWASGLRETLRLLLHVGIAEPLAFELHAPLPFARTALLDALEAAQHLPPPRGRRLAYRSLWANLAGLEGTRREDVKVWPGEPWDEEADFVSTNDTLWRTHPAAEHVRALHPDPGPYEVVA